MERSVDFGGEKAVKSSVSDISGGRKGGTFRKQVRAGL
jgi:hypothetical protein